MAESLDSTQATALGKMATQVANIEIVAGQTDASMRQVRKREQRFSEKEAELKATVSSASEEATKLQAKHEKAAAEEAAKREEHAKAAQELAAAVQDRLRLEAELRRLEAELVALKEEATVYEERIQELENEVALAKIDLQAAKEEEREAKAAMNAAESELVAAEAAFTAAQLALDKAESELREAELTLKQAEQELATKEEVLAVFYAEKAEAAIAHSDAVRQMKLHEAKLSQAQEMLQVFSIMKAAATAAAMALSASVVGAGVAASIVATLAAMEAMHTQQVETANQRLALATKEVHERKCALEQLTARVKVAEKEREEAVTATEMRSRECALLRDVVGTKRQERVLAEEKVLVCAEAYTAAVRIHSKAAAKVRVQALDLESAQAGLEEIRDKIIAKESEIKNAKDNLLAVANNAEKDLRQNRVQQWSSVSVAALARVQVSRDLARTVATRDAANFNLAATSVALEQIPQHIASLQSLKEKVTAAKDSVTQEQLELINKAKEKAKERAEAQKKEKDTSDADVAKKEDKQQERDPA